MGFNPAHRYDQARRQKRQAEQIRQLRTRPHGHAEAKTYVREGAIDTSIVLPPVFYAVDPDNTIPEVKLLYELRGMLGAGTCNLSWTHNGVALTGADMTLTTDPVASVTILPLPVLIAHGDYFQPTVTAATGAADLSLALFVVTRQA